MPKARLLHAVCTVAMLAAVPAFAQSNTTPGSASNSGMPQTPPGQAAMPNNGSDMSQNNNSSMAPAGNSGMTGNSGMNNGTNSTAYSGQGRMHHQAMERHRHMMQSNGGNGSSQDAEVERLNNQSLHAAQQGQTFNAADAGMSSGGMSGSGMSSGGMNGSSGNSSAMPAGTMSTNGAGMGTGAGASSGAGATTGASSGTGSR